MTGNDPVSNGNDENVTPYRKHRRNGQFPNFEFKGEAEGDVYRLTPSTATSAEGYHVSGLRNSALMSSVVLSNQIAKQDGNRSSLFFGRSKWNHNFAASLIVPILGSLLSAAWLIRSDVILFSLRRTGAYIMLGVVLVTCLATWRSATELIALHTQYSARKRREVSTMHGSIVNSMMHPSAGTPNATNSTMKVLWIVEILGPASSTVLLVAAYFHTVCFSGFFLSALGDFLAPVALVIPLVGTWITGESGLTDVKWNLLMKTIAFLICVVLFLTASVRNKVHRWYALAMMTLPLAFVTVIIVIFKLKRTYSVDPANGGEFVSPMHLPQSCQDVEGQCSFSKFDMIEVLRTGLTYASCLEFFLLPLLTIEPTTRAQAAKNAEQSPADRQLEIDVFGVKEYSTSVSRFVGVATISACISIWYIFVSFMSVNTAVLREISYTVKGRDNFYNQVFGSGSTVYLDGSMDYSSILPGGTIFAWSFTGLGLVTLLAGLYRSITQANTVLYQLVHANPLPGATAFAQTLSRSRISAVTVLAVFCVMLLGEEVKILSLAAISSMIVFVLFHVLSAVILWLDDMSQQERRFRKMRLASNDGTLSFLSRSRYYCSVTGSAAATSTFAAVLCGLVLLLVSPFAFLMALVGLIAGHKYLIATCSQESAFRSSRLDNIKNAVVRSVLSMCNPTKLSAWKPNALVIAKVAAIGDKSILHDPDLSVLVEALSECANASVIGIPLVCEEKNSIYSVDDVRKQLRQNNLVKETFKDLGVDAVRVLFLPLNSFASILSRILPLSGLGGYEPNLIVTSYPETDDSELGSLLQESCKWRQTLVMVKTNSTLAPIKFQMVQEQSNAASPLKFLKPGRAKPVVDMALELGADLTHTKIIDVWWFHCTDPVVCLLPLLLKKSASFSYCQLRLFIVVSSQVSDEDVQAAVDRLKTLLKTNDLEFDDTTVLRTCPAPLFASGPSTSPQQSDGSPDLFSQRPSPLLALQDCQDVPTSPLRLVDNSAQKTWALEDQSEEDSDGGRFGTFNMPWPFVKVTSPVENFRNEMSQAADPSVFAKAAIALNQLIAFHSSPSTLLVTIMPPCPPGVEISTYRMFLESALYRINRSLIIVKGPK